MACRRSFGLIVIVYRSWVVEPCITVINKGNEIENSLDPDQTAHTGGAT